MNINPLFLKDFYKAEHVYQYPEGTTLIFNNFTPRKSRMEGVNHSVFFGLQYFMKKYLDEMFGHFFLTKSHLPESYTRFMNVALGNEKDYKHIKELHDLGYLPIAIYALPELSVVPCGVPALVMHNTLPEFYWLPNMLETILSCTLWGASTSATIAREYKKLLDEYAGKTSDMPEFVDYQAHDFSFRGMNSLESACISGMAHLQYFRGTDTIPALIHNYKYYDKPIHFASVPATEHSVMSAGTKENEYETFERLLDIYPTGIISVVSDTWDLWSVVNNILPRLKDRILNRSGKLVIRPDSGDPVDIICGKEYFSFPSMEEAIEWADEDMEEQASNDCEGSFNCGLEEYFREFKVDNKYYRIVMTAEYGRHDKTYYYLDESEIGQPYEIQIGAHLKGVIEILWEIFGGTINSKGFKQLDDHIGCIYGDSITLNRAREICERLQAKGFASTNITFGIGSYTYQYNTRDTLGWAMKATYCEVDGIGRAITKDPITDDGTKKSHSGILKVVKVEGSHGYSYQVLQDQTWEQFHMPDNELKLVYENGKIIK